MKILVDIVVFTHDLDFSALLATTQAAGPSVVQVRARDVTPEHLEPTLVAVLEAHRDQLEQGARARPGRAGTDRDGEESEGAMDQRALGWIGVVLMVGGCAGSERVDGASASQCEALCAQFERCDSSTDELECRTDCEEDEAFSGAFWGSVHQCVAEELSCDEIAGPEYGDCLRDNLRASEPSPAAAEACSVMATRADECNAEIDQSAFEEECVGFFAKVASDALISGVRACYEDSSCDRIAGCVAEVLDDFDVDGAAGDGWVPLPSSPAMSEPPGSRFHGS